MKKATKPGRATPLKASQQARQGYFIIFPPRQNFWFDQMTAEERREIDAFDFAFDDPALLKKQMTKWRKAWNRIYNRVGSRPGLRKIYDDGHTRLTGVFPY